MVPFRDVAGGLSGEPQSGSDSSLFPGRRESDVTTDARPYRVHTRILRDGEPALVLLDLTPTDDPADAYEPAVVRAEGYDDGLAETVAGLEAGNVVTARLDWTGPDAVAAFETVSVERQTRYRFAADVEGLFEAARETWRAAREAGESVGSRVTRDTDGEPNGALYVFADPAGRDVYDEFRSGRRPVDPLVERVNEASPAADEDTTPGAGAGLGSLASRLEPADDAPEATDETGAPAREVFVLSPADGAFVVVYVVFRRDGLLAETVRDTYEGVSE